MTEGGEDVSMFVGATGGTPEEAQRLLVATGNSVEAAVNQYFARGHEQPYQSHEQPYQCHVPPRGVLMMPHFDLPPPQLLTPEYGVMNVEEVGAAVPLAGSCCVQHGSNGRRRLRRGPRHRHAGQSHPTPGVEYAAVAEGNDQRGEGAGGGGRRPPPSTTGRGGGPGNADAERKRQRQESRDAFVLSEVRKQTRRHEMRKTIEDIRLQVKIAQQLLDKLMQEKQNRVEGVECVHSVRQQRDIRDNYTRSKHVWPKAKDVNDDDVRLMYENVDCPYYYGYGATPRTFEDQHRRLVMAAEAAAAAANAAAANAAAADVEAAEFEAEAAGERLRDAANQEQRSELHRRCRRLRIKAIEALNVARAKRNAAEVFAGACSRHQTEEEEELEDGYTLDNDPSGAQCSRPRKSRNHEKWQRYKEIFSLYYAENGDLRMPQSYEHQGLKIGMILYHIRQRGNYVKDNPQRKQWLLERGVILTYDSGLCLSDTTSVEKWQRYEEIFSLYYAEHGDLNMPFRYEYQGVKIGSILYNIRCRGDYVRDNAPRKLWLLEKGVSFTYDSEKSSPEEKWQRYKEIFSLFYAEHGDLNISARYEHQGIKIGRVLSEIRLKGNFVKDNPQRKQWLLEKGVSFTYDS